MFRVTAVSLAALALAGAAPRSVAQQAPAWPQKNVTFVIPAPPGGTSDTLARVVAEQLRANSGRTVIVDNKPGAAGTIAIHAVLGAEPDGHTLWVGPEGVLTEIPHVFPIRFDPMKDVKPVAELARSSLILVAHPGLSAGNLKELIAHAKANPGKLSFASYSPGTASHYAGLILNQRAGIDLLHVPYKGSPPALTDLAAGQVPLMFDGLVTSLPLVRGHKLKGLAVTSEARSSFLQDVPTFKELGYPEINFSASLGVFASGKTPAALVARINSGLLAALGAPKVREHLSNLAFETPAPLSPAQYEQNVAASHTRNGAIVKSFNIKFQ
jgi:tripartite-type tricarboxylate transporter receptor subunit TctC